MLQILYDIIAYNLPLFYRDNLPIMRPSQGFWGFREKGYLFSEKLGEASFILRDLGRKHLSIAFWNFREQGAEENIL